MGKVKGIVLRREEKQWNRQWEMVFSMFSWRIFAHKVGVLRKSHGAKSGGSEQHPKFHLLFPQSTSSPARSEQLLAEKLIPGKWKWKEETWHKHKLPMRCNKEKGKCYSRTYQAKYFPQRQGGINAMKFWWNLVCEMENNSSHTPSRKQIANWNKHGEGLHKCSGAWRGLRRLG